MTKPLIFISHKHADAALAKIVAQFIVGRSLGSVDAYVSSDYNFSGPRVGANLTATLRDALWRADAVILVYTSADQDWSICMWECGVATSATSPDTTVVVFQCGRDVPTPFANDLRVDVRNPERIRRFTERFLTDPGFLPSLGRAVAAEPKGAPVEEASQELFEKMKAALPSDVQSEEWSVWPFMRLALPMQQIAQLGDTATAERVSRAHEIVREHAVVVKSDGRAAHLFGLAYLSERQMFKDLLAAWQEHYPTSDPTWFDSCCEQIRASARRGFPVIQWTPLREVGGETEFTPVLSRVKRLPFVGSMEFDILFYNLSDPQAVPVASKMAPPNRFFYKDTARTKPAELGLRELVAELDARGHDRVAILDADAHPLFVVHRGMVEKFIAREFLRSDKPAAAAADLTLADMLALPDMEKEGENFVVIKKKATLAEARSSMLTTPGCRDVFVTEHGKWDEPVLGWLTDLDIPQTS